MTVVVSRRQPIVNVKDSPYNAKGDSTTGLDGTDDTAAFIAAQAAGDAVFVPEGQYRITSWIPMLSGRRWFGVGPESIVANDQSNATVDKRACFLPGLHHPALMASQTKYALDTIAYGAPTVTFTTAGDAANVGVGDLVIVGSDTAISGVSRHAQLNKVLAKSGGTVTLVDPIEADISDAKLWTISGTDSSTSTGVYAVEDVLVEHLGFKGRSAFATKGAVFRGTFRDLTMVDVANFVAMNMLTNVVFERLRGQYCSRYLEFAFNSYNVVARDIKGRFTSPAGAQASASMILPIHLGEQPYRILLDDVQCHIDARHTTATELIQAKGSKIAVRRSDFRHAGNAGSVLLSIPDCSYTGHRFDDIVFDDCRFAAPSKARIAQIGGSSVAAENPRDVHVRGGGFNESVTGESVWFQAGQNFSCSAVDRTGKTIKVSAGAQYPTLNGYRRTA